MLQIIRLEPEISDIEVQQLAWELLEYIEAIKIRVNSSCYMNGQTKYNANQRKENIGKLE
jgi:hypothetical protein